MERKPNAPERERLKRERLERERKWLASEVAAARSLTDADRVRILRELWRASEAIRAGKTPEELRREDEARRALDRRGKERYLALAERLGKPDLSLIRDEAKDLLPAPSLAELEEMLRDV